ncbi:MAG: GNAT family N-acetyltransferase [Actinobacteria bacterium]|nr:MAG: GNAT family N-acetyltransferase [Actinomycetota bacterium]RIK08134.1 MAG: GNAT family N-acetyltransferase [Acidobacteriota bacterium]
MDEISTMARVKALWRTLAGDPDTLTTPGCSVVDPTEPGLCPDGWIGVVTLGDSAVIEAPPELRSTIEERLVPLHPEADLTDPEVIFPQLGAPAVFLGPAILAYPESTELPEPEDGPAVEVLGTEDSRVIDILESVSAEEELESGIDGASELFAALVDGIPRALAGYQRWPQEVAHMGVVTHTDFRDRGLARAAAEAAIRDALSKGLLPQWRVRQANSASIWLASRLGLVPMGRQLSFLLTGTIGAPTEQQAAPQSTPVEQAVQFSPRRRD